MEHETIELTPCATCGKWSTAPSCACGGAKRLESFAWARFDELKGFDELKAFSRADWDYILNGRKGRR